MCDLEREIGRRLSGRILGVHPFANPNKALAPGREQLGVNSERANARGAINRHRDEPDYSRITRRLIRIAFLRSGSSQSRPRTDANLPAQLRRSDALNITARAVRSRPDFRIQTYLRGSVALRGCVVAPSAARYSRNWASSLREPSAFSVCSVSLA